MFDYVQNMGLDMTRFMHEHGSKNVTENNNADQCGLSVNYYKESQIYKVLMETLLPYYY